MKYIYRRCLTAFRCQPMSKWSNLERCLYQWRFSTWTLVCRNKFISLRFWTILYEDTFTNKIIWADFEGFSIKVNDDDDKMFYKQVPITVGYYIFSRWENTNYIHIKDHDCVNLVCEANVRSWKGSN